MKKRNILLSAAVAGAIALTTAPASVLAETSTTVSKPAGAMGSGQPAMGQPKSNQFWWPDQLDLSPLRDHDSRSNPLGVDFNYAEAFSKLDLAAVKADIDKVLTDSSQRLLVHHNMGASGGESMLAYTTSSERDRDAGKIGCVSDV